MTLYLHYVRLILTYVYCKLLPFLSSPPSLPSLPPLPPSLSSLPPSLSSLPPSLHPSSLPLFFPLALPNPPALPSHFFPPSYLSPFPLSSSTSFQQVRECGRLTSDTWEWWSLSMVNSCASWRPNMELASLELSPMVCAHELRCDVSVCTVCEC